MMGVFAFDRASCHRKCRDTDAWVEKWRAWYANVV